MLQRTPTILATLASLLLVQLVRQANCAYPANFHNQTGCLYSYVDDDSRYSITFPDAEPQNGALKSPSYGESSCVQGTTPGNLVLSYSLTDNNMVSMKLTFQVMISPSEGYWEVQAAKLEFKPHNNDLFPEKEIKLKAVDIYAGQSFSYSCNSLVLENLMPTKLGPHFRITLKRFQLQPFHEPANTVFAPSYDCAVWLTLPVVMGLLLILFIVFTVLIGVYLILEQGNQTSDLRFSKQGGTLMNQAQLDATKG